MKKGFTIIELIIVIAIIGIVAAGIFVAINPAKRLTDANNSSRMLAVNAFGDAIQKYQADNDGDLPGNIDTSLRMIGTATSGCNVNCIHSYAGSGSGVSGGVQTEVTASACVDISSDLALYLPTFPIDPQVGTEDKTYYAIKSLTPAGFKVVSCNAESGEIIETTR